MDYDRTLVRCKARALWIPVLLIGILLLALGLRLYRIDAQSLWNDEGTSVALAARDLATITRGAANDIHPPLYYYLLHFWMALFGRSELAVRSLSALLGTLVVLMTFALGCVLSEGRSCVPGHDLWRGGRANCQFALPSHCATGLLAAWFAAVSPFQVYYSQETRMYMLTTLLGAVSVYSFLRLPSGWFNAGVHGPRRVVSLLYIASTVLLLYSHYFAVTIVLVENAAFLWWSVLARRRDGAPRLRSLLLRWVALQAMVGLSYAPWLLVAKEQLRVWPAISAPVRLTDLLLDLLRVFSLGLSVPARAGPVLLGYAGLLLLGLLVPRRWPSRDGAAAKPMQLEPGDVRPVHDTPRAEGAEGRIGYVVTVLYLCVPIGVMYLLSLQRPMYNPKFLLLCSVPFCLFLARGALSALPGPTAGETANPERRPTSPRVRLWLGRALLMAATVFVVATSLHSLRAYYFDARYARDDYRGIVRYIQAVATPDDAVLINAPGQIETFTYYYGGELPVYPLPRQRPLDEAQTRVDLEQMVQGRKRIFAVLWATDESDPGRFIEDWLDQYAYKATDGWYGNVRLAVYAVPERPFQGQIEHPLRVDLGDTVRLLGYNLPSAEVRPGDILQLTCIWQAVAPMSERYKVFTHVVDAYGHLVGQRDAEPGGGAKITTIWEAGEQVVDNYGLPILPGAPPGEYVLKIGMYGLSDGRRLPIIENGQAVGDSILLQPVRVLPALATPPLSVLGMRRAVDARFQDIVLLGYDLAKLGQEHEPDAPIHGGDILHLTLFWQVASQEGMQSARTEAGGALVQPTVPVENLAVLLQLYDAGSKVWLERRAQPTEGLYPTTQWRVNEVVRDQHNLFLPADLPPGKSYRLVLSVQSLSSGATIGSAVTLTPLAISD